MSDEPKLHTREVLKNGVEVETLITSDDEIRLSVKHHGVIVFNKALKGKYTIQKMIALRKEQNEVVWRLGGVTGQEAK